jgi:transposase-like protein
MLVSTSTLGGHVDTIDSQVAPGRRRRRLHSDEFKADAVAAAAQPGVSMASVAMARGINANLLRRWVRDTEVAPVKALASFAPTPTIKEVKAVDPLLACPDGDRPHCHRPKSFQTERPGGKVMFNSLCTFAKVRVDRCPQLLERAPFAFRDSARERGTGMQISNHLAHDVEELGALDDLLPAFPIRV